MRAALELRPTAVDRKLEAGCKRCVEREEENGLRDLGRRPEPLHWNYAGYVLLDLSRRIFVGERLFEDAGVDGTGRHGVDANPARKELGAQHSGERP